MAIRRPSCASAPGGSTGTPSARSRPRGDSRAPTRASASAGRPGRSCAVPRGTGPSTARGRQRNAGSSAPRGPPARRRPSAPAPWSRPDEPRVGGRQRGQGVEHTVGPLPFLDDVGVDQGVQLAVDPGRDGEPSARRRRGSRRPGRAVRRPALVGLPGSIRPSIASAASLPAAGRRAPGRRLYRTGPPARPGASWGVGRSGPPLEAGQGIGDDGDPGRSGHSLGRPGRHRHGQDKVIMFALTPRAECFMCGLRDLDLEPEQFPGGGLAEDRRRSGIRIRPVWGRRWTTPTSSILGVQQAVTWSGPGQRSHRAAPPEVIVRGITSAEMPASRNISTTAVPTPVASTTSVGSGAGSRSNDPSHRAGCCRSGRRSRSGPAP